MPTVNTTPRSGDPPAGGRGHARGHRARPARTLLAGRAVHLRTSRPGGRVSHSFGGSVYANDLVGRPASRTWPLITTDRNTRPSAQTLRVICGIERRSASRTTSGRPAASSPRPGYPRKVQARPLRCARGRPVPAAHDRAWWRRCSSRTCWSSPAMGPRTGTWGTTREMGSVATGGGAMPSSASQAASCAEEWT
jgi:hypothetical protein